MNCKKCRKAIPDGAVFCPWCGTRQEGRQERHRRGNGQGTAYRRGPSWTASVVIAWKLVPGDPPKAVPVKRTKGGFRTKRDALEYIPILREDARQTKRKAPPLAHYWGAYENGRMDRLSDSKRTSYRIAWAKLKDLAWFPVDRITITDLQSVVSAAAPTYYTARDCKLVLTRLFEMAAAEGWVSKDLPSFIELPKLQEKEREIFSAQEQTALWKLYEAGDIRAGIPLLMIATGMMPGEMMRLRVEHIDLAVRKITGVGLKTKVRRESAVYLPADILPIVEDLITHARPDGYLWRRTEKYWYEDYYAALAAAGCRRLEPYCCRHTTATRLAVTHGIAPQTVRRVMRWSTARMLDRYAHPDDQDALAALDQVTVKTSV